MLGTIVLNASLISIITGIGAMVVPLLTSLLKKITWSPQIKQLIAGLISFVVALVAIIIESPHGIFGVPLAQTFALIYTASQFVYGMYFKGSTVDTILTNALYKKSGVANTPHVTTSSTPPTSSTPSTPPNTPMMKKTV